MQGLWRDGVSTTGGERVYCQLGGGEGYLGQIVSEQRGGYEGIVMYTAIMRVCEAYE